MGNCINIREIKQNIPTQSVNFGSLEYLIEHHRELVSNAKMIRRQQLEKQLRKIENGGYGSSEEEDKVIIDEHDNNVSKTSNIQQSNEQQSMSKQSIKIQSRNSFQQGDELMFQDKLQKNEKDSQGNQSNSEIYNYNSEDELQQYFGGTKSQQKTIKVNNVLASIINQEDKSPLEQIKTFNNTIFKKDESEEQAVGNVFSDNDISFDDRGKSPELKFQQY